MSQFKKYLIIALTVFISIVLLTTLVAAIGEEGAVSLENDVTSTDVTDDISSVDSDVAGDTESGEDGGDEDDDPESDQSGDADTTTSEIRLTSDKPINGGTMDDWTDTDMDITASTVSVNGNKTAAPKKDIFDLRGVAARLMVLTIIIGLLCILALVYVNVAYRKKSKAPKEKLKKGKKSSRRPRY